MFEFEVLLAFVPAALALNLSPGPDSLYTLTRAISDGRTTGIAAALGTSTGVLVHTTAAVLGISAILRASALAFSVVKLVGAGYLVYLGVRTLRSHEEFEISPETEGANPIEAYRHAITINVLNPKVALFFLAFLPQFVQPTGDVSVQLLVLGVLFATLGFCYQAILATFSSKARRALTERERVQSVLRYASGSVLVGFGVALAFETRASG